MRKLLATFLTIAMMAIFIPFTAQSANAKTRKN